MKPATILIIDDQANIRLMLRTVLKLEGYGVREAANGREALKAVEREAPDLMILDLSMPLLDGMGVLQRLNEAKQEKRPRVVVLTAHGSIAAAVKATRLGAADFLEKPVSPDELREVVRAALTDESPARLPPARLPPAGDDGRLDGGYRAVLDRVRKALRLSRYANAETLLMKAADLAHNDAAYFNLLGVLYEAQRDWKLARKFYGKAITLDTRYQPAQQNMRRIYELITWGRSKEAVTLGDEIDEGLKRPPAARGVS